MYLSVQSFKLPSLYKAQRKVFRGKRRCKQINGSKSTSIDEDGPRAYYEVIYWKLQLSNYKYLDSCMPPFNWQREKRFDRGWNKPASKRSLLKRKGRKSPLALKQVQASLEKSYVSLHQLLQTDSIVELALLVWIACPCSLGYCQPSRAKLSGTFSELSKQQINWKSKDFCPMFLSAIFRVQMGSGTPILSRISG